MVVERMCDKCKSHAKHWVHIADQWTIDEMVEMYEHLRQFVRQR